MDNEKMIEYDKNSFICPYCSVFSQQTWIKSITGEYLSDHEHNYFDETEISNLELCKCHACDKYSIWINKKMVYPIESKIELPNEDMPEEIKKDFLEARNIVNMSPRGACAILRLALDKLLTYLEIEGDTLYSKITSYCENNNVDDRLTKAFHSIRIIGNESVHIGNLRMEDDIETAGILFSMLNFIVDETITKTRKINHIYSQLPENKTKKLDK